jgi:hypothetical protein
MPITQALKTAQELRAAGMPAALAEVVAAKLEESAGLSRDAAFDSVKAELSLLRSELKGEMGSLKSEIKGDLERSLREVQGRMLTAILGVGALIITLRIGLKIFS